MKKHYKPRVNGSRLTYTFFRHYLWPFIVLFYRRRQVVGRSNVPKNKPIFMIPNHQNAFYDPISLTTCYNDTQFTFLLRAAAFNKKLMGAFYTKLNMLPIYRQLDGNDQLDKNNEILQNCVWLLERKKTIMCFAEGSHSLVRRLRPFKKGPLRFAIAAEEKNSWQLDVHFVPVGLNYDDMTNYGGNHLVIFGKPIRLADYYQTYLQNPAKALNELKRDLENALLPLMIHIKSEQYYESIEVARTIAVNYFRAKSNNTSTLYDEFLEGNKTIAHIENNIITNDEKAVHFESLIWEYEQKRKPTGLLDSVFDKHYRPIGTWAIVPFLLGLPVFLIGLAFYGIPFFLPTPISNKIVKDPAFFASIKWAFGWIFFTLFSIINMVVVGLVFHNWWYVLATVPVGMVFGAGALFYLRKWRKFIAGQKAKRFLKTNEGKKLQSLREQILQLIRE